MYNIIVEKADRTEDHTWYATAEEARAAFMTLITDMENREVTVFGQGEIGAIISGGYECVTKIYDATSEAFEDFSGWTQWG